MARRSEQVVRISSDAGRGSGYLVAPGLVLTARHILDGLDGPGNLRVGRLTGGDLTVSEIIRPSDDALDVALLRVPRDESDETTVIAVADVEEPVEVSATGFPRVQRQDEERDPESVRGMSQPLSGPHDAISVDVASAVPVDAAGWRGLSGAALFTVGGALLGVVVNDQSGFGGRRLEALPVTRLLDDPRLRQALPTPWRGSAKLHLSSLLAFRIGSGSPIRVRSFEPLMTTALRESLLTSWLKPLRAEFQVVPFIGRDEALARLSGWLTTSRTRFSFALVSGPAGSGKSRMAAELCRRAIADGWVAGLTETGVEPARADLANLRVPVLLVQDYMDNNAESAATFIERAMVTDRKEPIRFLFLVRSAERFIKQLNAALPWDDPQPAEVIRLQAHELSESERAEHYDRASAAFAILRGVDRPALRTGDRASAAFVTPLLVHAQALVDLLDEPDETGEAAPDALAHRLLDRLLVREDGRFWKPALADFEVNEDTREDCFAIASIVDAFSADEAGRLLTLAHGLTGRLDLAIRIAERMNKLYADDGFLPPVQPDLLGERLIERRLLDSRKVDELFTVADAPAQRSHMLEILLRMCGSPYPTTRTKAAAALGRVLAHHLPDLVRQAIALNSAPSDPATDPLPDRIAAALSLVDVPKAATEAAQAEFPMASRTQALAAAVYEQAAQHFEQAQDHDALIDMLQKATLARLYAGQADAALPLSARTMNFASRFPTLSQHQRLSKILGSQSLVRASIGNVEGAVDSAQRAVRMIEDAAREAGDSDRFAEALAESRTILAQALMAAAEPIRALKVLAATITDIDRLPANTAIEVLGLQAVLAVVMEDLPEAQWAAARARDLSPPGSEQYAVHTALLAALHDAAGDTPEALRLAAEAIDAVDALPDQPAEHVRYRSAAVRYFAAQVFAVHDDDTAERYLTEARDQMKRLYDEAPELYGFNYVMIRLVWAVVQSGDQAVREASIAASIVDDLFQKRPSANWAMLLPATEAQVAALTAVGRASDAVGVFDETIAKLRRFGAPSGMAIIANLLTKKALLMLEHVEDSGAAVGPVAEARRIYDLLVANDPAQFITQSVGAAMVDMLALHLSDRGEDALRAGHDAVQNAERLVELTGTDASRRVRAQALATRGRLHRDNDRFSEALTDFRQARADLLDVLPIADDEDEINQLDQGILEMEDALGTTRRAAEAATAPRPADETVRSRPLPDRAEVADAGRHSVAPGRDGTKAKVVVAIDFGTHGTGFAWTLVSPDNDDPRERQVYHRRDWPKAPARVIKDLSAVVVDEENGPVAWGYEAYELWWLNSRYKREELGLHGYAYAFKMALSSRPTNREVARSEGTIDLRKERTVRRLIASTLGQMRKHAVAAVEGSGLGLTQQDIQWCITVPAIWSDAQKLAMRQAAEEAGLDAADQVLIAIEPETAALYCILDAGRSNTGATLWTGGEQRFMIVDCGGGTIDISAFASTADGGRLQLAEIGTGSTGAALGSQYINHAFRTRLLRQRLSPDVFDFLDREHGDLITAVENQWEEAKQYVTVDTRTGQPEVAGPISLDLTELWPKLPKPVRRRLVEEADDDPRTLLVTPQETQALFDKIIDPIVALVRRAFDDLSEHIGDAPVTVLLVGGFARNDYLHARISHGLEGRATVARPTEPREAVLHGAVHFCYNPKLITQRRARLTYGFQMALPFREGSQDIHHDIIRGPDQQKLIRDRFQIAVRRSQAVQRDQPYRKILTPSSAQTPELRVTFFASRDPDPQYIGDDGVVQLGEIVIDISHNLGRPPADRKVRLDLVFGDTTITATATDLDTETTHKIDIPFDAQFDDPDQANALGHV